MKNYANMCKAIFYLPLELLSLLLDDDNDNDNDNDYYYYYLF